MAKISFQDSNVSFVFPFSKREILTWVSEVIRAEGYELEELSYVFTSDNDLLKINKTYLNHEDFTDIITFDYSENPMTINGEILISVERVKENAKKYQSDFKHELVRVMIHGVIHLLGYDDKTPNQKKIMRKKENACISLLKI